MAKAVASSFRRLSTQFTMRVFSTTTSAAGALSKPSPLTTRRYILPMSQAILQSLTPTAHFRVGRAGYSSYSPLNSGSSSSSFSDRPPTEMAPLFPGCDYNHWLIVMDKPGGEGATKQQMIDAYVQTLAKILGRYKTLVFNIYIEMSSGKEIIVILFFF
ncbi:multiple organellar RNA editing factor 6, mitochondrial [Lathyrus oleraceus]|uniref:multiple organellar RNA editing factor 6, mitochondrial n=1 Tax=Pisum sativum TaxID=3888 RepID=UPI0021CEB218|nr:multiple organellar RNA editing factor 6, mitochondrial-like [Pisum sativum]